MTSDSKRVPSADDVPNDEEFLVVAPAEDPRDPRQEETEPEK